MPSLGKIIIQNFRNIELQEVEFSPNVNCISGNNGAGKTNLLDAIYYLSMCKSSLCPMDRFNFRYGAGSFAISGSYLMPGGKTSRFTVRSGPGNAKKFLRDDKPYERISEHIGVIPLVMVSPSDSELINESGEERRKFINSVLSQLDRNYLLAVQQYNKLLSQRNQTLKSDMVDDYLLDVLDDQMSRTADDIFHARQKLISNLKPLVQKYYGIISSDRESVCLDYKSDIQKTDLKVALKHSREKDKLFKFTTVGPQRDDFIFTMNGAPIRKCGSQGQQKSFLVALKFAEYDIMKRTCGFAPIMLLDDLFDKFDLGRVHNLLDMVAGHDFGQIFLSDSNKTRISTIVDDITSDRAYFEAAGGVFTRKDE